MLYKVPAALRKLYRAFTNIFDGLKDSWIMVLKKPNGWQPQLRLPYDELRPVLQRSTSFQY